MFARLLFVLAFAVVGSAQAGYFATVTQIVTPESQLQLGANSACYLTPSMAIAGLAGLAGGQPAFVESIDSASGTFAAYYYQQSPIRRFTGTFSTCVANPAVTAFPTFIGGATDPALQGGSVLAGSSSGGGSSGSVTGTVTMTPYVPTDAEKRASFQDGALAGTFIFTAMAGAYAFVLLRRAL